MKTLGKAIFISFFLLVVIAVSSIVFLKNKPQMQIPNSQSAGKAQIDKNVESGESLHPLSIAYMREQTYPGSEVTIEEKLSSGSNHDRYIASYKSEGLKIFALLTIPRGENPPAGGWPVVIFNHGYIPPEQYKTTEKYLAYTDAFSRNGYVLFRPDFRGFGNSEGQPEGAYYSPAYTIDVLNAVSSIVKLKDPKTSQDNIVNSNKIGMWGHSMGGTITLRAMVVADNIRAGVIWAGVTASYQDLAENWQRSRPWTPSRREEMARHNRGRPTLIAQYGDYHENPEFWNSIAPINFVSEISGPLELHHGTADSEVPHLFSEKLRDAMIYAGQTVELYTYPRDDHNLSQNLNLALFRSVAFFDKYVKGAH